MLERELVEQALSRRDYSLLRNLFKGSQPADIAEVIAESHKVAQVNLFRLIARSRRALVFSYLPSQLQESFLDRLPDAIASPLLNEMEADDRTHFLEELSDELRTRVLLRLDPNEQKIARYLLSYPDDSIGRLMSPDFLSLDADMSVKSALELIHWNTTLPEEYLHHLFVTDSDGFLQGEVSLATLVVCDPPSQPIREVMSIPGVQMTPMEDQVGAIDIFKKYDHPCAPVVDEQGKLLGIVTVDDVFDVAEEEATEDIQQFGGQDALEEGYFETSVFTMLKKRGGWLILLFCGMLFAGSSLRAFEEILAKWSFLIFFLPIITSSGGNAGTQAASLVLRGLAIREMEISDWWRVMIREAQTGLFLGLTLGTLGYFRAWMWGYDPTVCLVIGSSLLIVVMFGALAGGLLPFFFQRISLDPAVVSSPFIATLVDNTAIIIFIKIAILVLGTL
ncbi:MAG: magnesium transporter [Oligoflexales bacterium]